jgi:hypothetical protein
VLRLPVVDILNFGVPEPKSITKLLSVVSSNPVLQTFVVDEKLRRGPDVLVRVCATCKEVVVFIGAVALIEVEPDLGEKVSALRVLKAITVLAVKEPTSVALPVVVSPNVDAVIASDATMSTMSFVLSSHAWNV